MSSHEKSKLLQHKNLYISLFLLTIFGLIYYIMAPRNVRTGACKKIHVGARG